MELTKNIFFNTDKLIENTTVKISYTGKLFQNNSEDVNIHYGFGLNWNDINDIKMEKTELGFQAEVTLKEAETFNFCFNNNYNEWDNNQGVNYIFPIEKQSVSLVETGTDEFGIINPRKLKKSYIWRKKIKIAFLKLIKFIPRTLSKNALKKESIS